MHRFFRNTKGRKYSSNVIVFSFSYKEIFFQQKKYYHFVFGSFKEFFFFFSMNFEICTYKGVILELFDIYQNDSNPRKCLFLGNNYISPYGEEFLIFLYYKIFLCPLNNEFSLFTIITTYFVKKTTNIE